MSLQTLGLDDLTIRDEKSLRHIGLYDSLKRLLRDDGVQFRVPTRGSHHARWDRVLFLNLTFWDASSPRDVLVDASIDADVLAHVAWHHAARKALIPEGGAASADALFLGEAIASAFDLYLIGRTLGREAEVLETQVPAMCDVLEGAGLTEAEREALFTSVAADPDRAFEDLRALLFDVTTTLAGCPDVDAAAAALEGFATRRFAPMLHHYELSNWILYARAYAARDRGVDARVRSVDRALREAPVALDWLEARWLPA